VQGAIDAYELPIDALESPSKNICVPDGVTAGVRGRVPGELVVGPIGPGQSAG